MTGLPEPSPPVYAIDQEIAQLRDLMTDVPVAWLETTLRQAPKDALLDALEAVVRFAPDPVLQAVLPRFADEVPALVLRLTARDRLDIEPLQRLRERLETLRNTQIPTPDPAAVVARVLRLGLNDADRRDVLQTLLPALPGPLREHLKETTL